MLLPQARLLYHFIVAELDDHVHAHIFLETLRIDLDVHKVYR